MTLKELTNQVLADLEYKEIFKGLADIDGEIKNQVNPFEKNFYFRKQDQINHIYGELLSAYGTLKKELESYLAVRKYQIVVEFTETNNMTINDKKLTSTRVPGNELLESYVLSEIPELHKACVGLEKWVERAQNTIRTCRSHTYGEDRGNN